jgi:hypothetical protein
MSDFKNWEIDSITGASKYIGPADMSYKYEYEYECDLGEEITTFNNGEEKVSKYKEYFDVLQKNLYKNMHENFMEELYGKPTKYSFNYFENIDYPNKNGDIFTQDCIDKINSASGYIADGSIWGNSKKISDEKSEKYKYNYDDSIFKTEYGCYWYDGENDYAKLPNEKIKKLNVGDKINVGYKFNMNGVYEKGKPEISLNHLRDSLKYNIMNYREHNGRKKILIGVIKK